MKKQLYGTTFLVALGLSITPAAAGMDPIHLELGGSFKQNFGFGEQDLGTSTANQVSYQNNEVHFKMRGELDNGLVIGGAIELEAESTGDQIDQHYVTLSGGFGQLRLGSINSGRYSMIIGSPNVGLGPNSGSQGQYMTMTDNGGGTATSTYSDISGDSQKITYFTPRFSGFQLAASWSPTTGTTAGEDNNLASDLTEYQDAWDFGVSYKGDINDASISAMLGVGGAHAPSVAKAAGFDNWLTWNAGVKVGYAGFTVGGGVTVNEEGQSNAAGTTSNEGTAWTLGASYSTGPYSFSVARFEGNSKGFIARADDSERESWAVGAKYQIGPGLSTSLTFYQADTKGQAAATGTTVTKNDGTAVIWGLAVGF
jgi:hypothetical protein